MRFLRTGSVEFNLNYFTLSMAGDFNNDGTVDAADYTVWQDTLNQTGTALAADANRDGIVNHQDYSFWVKACGNTRIPPSSSAAVLEPSAILIVASAAISCVLISSRRSF